MSRIFLALFASPAGRAAPSHIERVNELRLQRAFAFPGAERAGSRTSHGRSGFSDIAYFSRPFRARFAEQTPAARRNAQTRISKCPTGNGASGETWSCD
jgi:hypothetical protein